MKFLKFAAIFIIQASAGLFLPAKSFDYILGSGDQISVKVHNIEGFDSTSYILPDGKIVLQRIDPLSIKGKTLKQARMSIENAYKSVFKVPVVSVELLEPRIPVITIDGEVSKPGIYSLSVEDNILQNWPKVSDAIEIAGGTKSNADLSSINLTRFKSNSKTKEVIKINLVSAITSGNPDSNINLLDNDRIFVPIQKNNSSQEVSRINNFSTLSPTKINVLVAGEVNSPGLIEIKPDRGLNTAIYTAGGFNARSSNKILLVRLTRQHYEEQVSINAKHLQKHRLGTLHNPILREGDIVIVGETAIAKFADIINTGFSPLRPIIDAAAIFRIFGI